MSVFALGDLHLAIGCPEKDMGIFGEHWKGYMDKMAAKWRELVTDEDLVLIPGDISWALKAEDAKVDLEWIDQLPGTKVMIRGNHDLWWGSLKKVKELSPPSIIPLHHTATTWNNISIAGTRLWDSPDEYSFKKYTAWPPDPTNEEEAHKLEAEMEQDRKIFEREMGRLEMACKALDQKAEKRIVMTHYAPIGSDLEDSRASHLLEQYHVDICIFGHLHGIDPATPLFGEKNGIQYLLVAADYVDFTPIKLL